MWTIQDEPKSSSNITLPFDLSCRVFFFLGSDGDFQVADCCFSCRSHRKHHVLSPVMIRLRHVPSLSPLSIRSPQMLVWSSRWSCVRTHGTLLGNTRHVQIIRQNFWQVPWLILAAAAAAVISSTIWEQLACTSVATSWILSSVLTVHGGPVCSSSKLSLPCEKHLCHLNTALWPKTSLLYACLIIWNVFLAD
jgi:hypothetical protein